MEKHLKKCHKNTSEGSKTCLFNAAHIYPENEINNHEENCPERLKMELFMIDYYCNISEGIKNREIVDKTKKGETNEEIEKSKDKDDNENICDEQKQQCSFKKAKKIAKKSTKKIPSVDVVMHYGLLLLITVFALSILFVSYGRFAA